MKRASKLRRTWVVLAGISTLFLGEARRAPAREASVAPPPEPAGPLTLHVPHIKGPVVIDAQLEKKKTWEADTGNTRNLKDAAGQGMVPYSEAKLRWGDGMLYLMLYAGDLDLEGAVTERDGPVEKDDAFHLEFGAGKEVRTVSVSVLGTVADALCTDVGGNRSCNKKWQSHARVAVDRDGTLNKIGDNDEEWVVEMRIPLSALGIARAGSGAHIPFSVRRCEVGHDGPHACGSWGARPRGELVLDP
jgi:hypothetical protein